MGLRFKVMLFAKWFYLPIQHIVESVCQKTIEFSGSKALIWEVKQDRHCQRMWDCCSCQWQWMQKTWQQEKTAELVSSRLRENKGKWVPESPVKIAGVVNLSGKVVLLGYKDSQWIFMLEREKRELDWYAEWNVWGWCRDCHLPVILISCSDNLTQFCTFRHEQNSFTMQGTKL